MTAVKKGDTVQIHYTGTLEDGTVFDSSSGRDPLEFTVGSGMIIAGLDAAIPGMTEGEKKTVPVPCAQAYGEINPDASQLVSRQDLPKDIPLEIGTQLQMNLPDGQTMMVRVTETTEDEVRLDANHALAGKDLHFAIELVAIMPA